MGNAEDLERNKKAVNEYIEKSQASLNRGRELLKKQDAYFNGLKEQQEIEVQSVRHLNPRTGPSKILVAAYEGFYDGLFGMATKDFDNHVTYEVVKSVEALERQAVEKPYNLMFIKTSLPTRDDFDCRNYDDVFNAIKAIKEGKMNSQTKMFLLSGSDKHRERARELGIERIIYGPIEIGELQVLLSENL